MDQTAYEEVGDARRAELIVELGKMVGEGMHFDAGLWACVWLSDVEKLEALVRRVSDSDKVMRRITFKDQDWAKVLRTCKFDTLPLMFHFSDNSTFIRGRTGSFIAK